MMIECIYGKPIAWSIPKTDVIDEKMARKLDYMDSNENVVYMIPDNIRFYDAYNVWSAVPMNYLDNVFYLRAHFILGQQQRLKSYDIDDPIQDMISKENIYTTFNKVWYKYLQAYYCEDITVSIVDRFEDTNFIKYMLPEEINAEEYGDYFLQSINVQSVNDSELESDFIQVDGIINSSDQLGERFTSYFLNLENGNERISYALKIDHERIAGKLLLGKDIYNTYDKMIICGKSANGQNIALADVTDQFADAFHD